MARLDASEVERGLVSKLSRGQMRELTTNVVLEIRVVDGERRLHVRNSYSLPGNPAKESELNAAAYQRPMSIDPENQDDVLIVFEKELNPYLSGLIDTGNFKRITLTMPLEVAKIEPRLLHGSPLYPTRTTNDFCQILVITDRGVNYEVFRSLRARQLSQAGVGL